MPSCTMYSSALNTQRTAISMHWDLKANDVHMEKQRMLRSIWTQFCCSIVRWRSPRRSCVLFHNNRPKSTPIYDGRYHDDIKKVDTFPEMERPRRSDVLLAKSATTCSSFRRVVRALSMADFSNSDYYFFLSSNSLISFFSSAILFSSCRARSWSW